MIVEVGANEKQSTAARRLRAVAAERLEVQRKGYESGRVTVGSYLAAISQLAAAESTEHQHLVTDKISRAAVSEAKGTLLAERGIAVAEGPRPRKSWQASRAKTDDKTKPASLATAASGGQDKTATQPPAAPSAIPPRSTPDLAAAPDFEDVRPGSELGTRRSSDRDPYLEAHDLDRQRTAARDERDDLGRAPGEFGR